MALRVHARETSGLSGKLTVVSAVWSAAMIVVAPDSVRCTYFKGREARNFGKCCLSSVALYGKGILDRPKTSLMWSLNVQNELK